MPDRLETEESASRRSAMAACAEARASELRAALERLSPLPEARELRPVESGLAMLRGRAGGDGAAFNLGEATVTRAALTLELEAGTSSPIGFAYHLGRDSGKARHAAIIDALWQVPHRRAAVEDALAPVRDRIASDRALAARRAAATRVNFFTLVRGED